MRFLFSARPMLLQISRFKHPNPRQCPAMKSNRLSAIVLCFVVALATNSFAATTFTATLTNDQENPPVTPTLTTGAPRPASFGTATFTLNDANTALTFTASIFNIDVTGTQTLDMNDNLVAAHIHAGANLPPLNNGVVWGFFGAPFNDTTPNDFVMTPFASGVGGTFSGKWDAPEGNGTTLAAQIPNILAGRSYINFHTTQFGGGEIRGQILAPAGPSVPDYGSTALLLAMGLAALLGVRQRVP
jgi:hypothetical protein